MSERPTAVGVPIPLPFLGGFLCATAAMFWISFRLERRRVRIIAARLGGAGFIIESPPDTGKRRRGFAVIGAAREPWYRWPRVIWAASGTRHGRSVEVVERAVGGLGRPSRVPLRAAVELRVRTPSMAYPSEFRHMLDEPFGGPGRTLTDGWRLLGGTVEDAMRLLTPEVRQWAAERRRSIAVLFEGGFVCLCRATAIRASRAAILAEELIDHANELAGLLEEAAMSTNEKTGP